MRKNLSLSELAAFLELPVLAVLATYRANGRVLLSPVWHEYVDGGFNVLSSWDDVKVRHLRADPRAVLLVAEQRPPYRGVELSTRAHLQRGGVGEVVERVATRYLGAEAGRAYARSASDDTLVRLEPGQVRAWDFADVPALGTS